MLVSARRLEDGSSLWRLMNLLRMVVGEGGGLRMGRPNWRDDSGQLVLFELQEFQ